MGVRGRGGGPVGRPALSSNTGGENKTGKPARSLLIGFLRPDSPMLVWEQPPASRVHLSVIKAHYQPHVPQRFNKPPTAAADVEIWWRRLRERPAGFDGLPHGGGAA